MVPKVPICFFEGNFLVGEEDKKAMAKARPTSRTWNFEDPNKNVFFSIQGPQVLQDKFKVPVQTFREALYNLELGGHTKPDVECHTVTRTSPTEDGGKPSFTIKCTEECMWVSQPLRKGSEVKRENLACALDASKMDMKLGTHELGRMEVLDSSEFQGDENHFIPSRPCLASKVPFSVSKNVLVRLA